MMELVCVILNYRTPEMTLKAARAARVALAKLDYRIDIVDNDSGDGSEDHLRQAVESEGWANVQVLQTGENGGFGFGNNFAIRRALASDDPPDFIYILNSDAFPEPDAVRTLLDFMNERPEVGIAGSSIHGPDGEPHLTAFRFPTLSSEVVGSFRLGALERVLRDVEVPIRPPPRCTQRVDWVAGASMMIRREVLEQVGLFDESFFLYFEETDLCRRAALAGWPTYYVSESEVVHIGSVSTGMKEARRMPRYWFDSRRHYFLKNHGRSYLWASNTAHAIGQLSYRVRARLQQKPPQDPPRYLRDFLRYNFVQRRP